MADPARYFISPLMRCDTDFETGVSSNHSVDLLFERNEAGEWIKAKDFDDYKAGVRRNNTEGTVSRLGLEIVELRTRLQAMEKAGNRLAKVLARFKKSDFEDEGIDKLVKNWEDASNA